MSDEGFKLVQQRWLVLLGSVAIAGHVLGVAADIYSGFVPSVSVPLGPITSISLDNIAPLFEAKPLSEARIGHYLAVLCIPLGIFGIWQVSLALDPTRNRHALAFLVLGTLGIVYGAFYHGTLAFVIGALQQGSLAMGTSPAETSPELVAYFNSLSEPLGVVLLVADVLVSGTYIAIVLWRRTLLPKWMAAFNPLSIQLVLNLLALLAPHPIGQLIWLTVFNASLAIWYVGTTMVLVRSGA